MRDWKKEIEDFNKDIIVIGDYNKKTNKIKLKCKIDNYEWEARAYDILKGFGCHRCSGNERYTTETFKDVVKSKGSIFEVLGEYRRAQDKILVRCNNCSFEYEKKAYTLLQDKGCIKCKYENFPKKKKEVFKKEFENKYGNVFTLVTDYDGMKEKIAIKHNVCGNVFYRTPGHVMRCSCICDFCETSSLGELEVKKALENLKIKYEQEKTFKDFTGLKKGGSPRFDFYIKDLSMCIEYDGIQHFEKVDFFGGYEGFKLTKDRDERKNNYCKGKNIKLLRIPYYEKDIEGTIKRFIEEVQK